MVSLPVRNLGNPGNLAGVGLPVAFEHFVSVDTNLLGSTGQHGFAAEFVLLTVADGGAAELFFDRHDIYLLETLFMTLI
jgi:hypothetical protein